MSDAAAPRLTIERRMTAALRARLPHGLAELAVFVAKQAWAALFGVIILASLLLTKAIWQADWAVARYDALLVMAIAVQALFLRFRLETWEEARVILLFHLTGTVMEWFKVYAGSWDYPEPGVFKILGVPLFSGFMYASVGSYIARALRLFDVVLAPFPPYWWLGLLGAAIYANFFAHHYLPDMRIALFAATMILFARVRLWFRLGGWYWMPLPVAMFGASFGLWVAEFVGTTLTGTWLYAGQSLLDRVSFAKMGSWYLLLHVCFATVLLVSRGSLQDTPFRPSPASGQRPAAARRTEAG